MPFSPGGVFSLVASYFAEPGTTIRVDQHNPVFEDVASGLSQALVRDGRAAMTGQFKAVSGTSSAPGIAFASDPTKGFYLDGDGNIVPTAPLGILPVGLGPLPWSTNTAPDGWVLDGATYSRADYPALASFALAAIAAGSYWFGPGDGSTTFTIADAKGCAIVGADADGSVIGSVLAVGGTTGSNSKTIAKANLPNTTFDVTIPAGQGSHKHNVTVYPPTGTSIVSNNVSALPQQVSSSTQTEAATLPEMTGTASSGGSGTALSVVQKSIGVRFIFKAK